MAEYLYEDFVEETMELFVEISKTPAVDEPFNDAPLLEVLNTAHRSDAIITHLKVRYLP